MKRRIALGCALAWAGCSDDVVLETGLVVRPSGLAHVTWVEDPNDPLAARGDVFIADAESGGVSIIQLAKFGTIVNGFSVADDRYVYARAPNLFFPLILPAPPYPTLVATASVAAPRMYALSTVDGRLHVYGIGPAPYDRSATLENPYVSHGSVELGAIEDPLGLAARLATGVVVDMAVLGDSPAGPATLLFALDDLAGGGALLTMEVSPMGSGVSARWVSTASVGAAPRDMVVRTAEPAGVLVSSAATSSISFVALSGRMLGEVRAIGVGGPTGGVVDAGDAGAVALRLDRPVVTILDVDGGQLSRARRPLLSPYSTTLDGPGELAIRAVAVAGAGGGLPRFPTTAGRNTGIELFSDADRDENNLGRAVYLAYTDAGGAFLIGRPLRWPTQSIRPLRVGYGSPIGVVFEGCSAIEPVVCEALGDAEATQIEPYVCNLPLAEPGVDRLRVTFRGAFAVAPVATLTRTTSSAPILATLTFGPGARGVEGIVPGDRVYVSGAIQAACTSSTALFGEATVRGASGSELSLEIDPGRLSGVLAGCGGPFQVRAEAFGPGPELVVDAGPGTAVLERLTTTATNGQYRARSSRGVVAELSVVDTATCVADVVPSRSCTTDADCPGAACVVSETNVCGGRCSAACDSTDGGCWRSALERRCPTAELAIAESAVSGAEISAGFGGSVSTVPEDVVFSSVRRGWIVSFPGSRSVGSVGLTPSGIIEARSLK